MKTPDQLSSEPPLGDTDDDVVVAVISGDHRGCAVFEMFDVVNVL